MKKLKNILQCRYIYIALVVIALSYSFIMNRVDKVSKYNINDTIVKGVITNIYIDGNSLSLELNAKEKIIAIHYFKDLESLNKFKDDFELGDRVILEGIMTFPSNNTVFNLFDYKEYLKHEGITYIFEISNIIKISDNTMIRYKIKNTIVNRIKDSINKDYLYTFILGNSKYIDSDIMDSYRINGISHLFAVSGMHISLISLILLKLFDKFKYKNVLVIIVLLFYMFLTDYSPSIMRAGIMFILLFLNKKFNLMISTINIMLLLLTILIFIDPFIIYKVGFQYSYIISFYLIIFNKIIRGSKNYITKLLKVSFIAFIAGLPITINSFFSINLLSVFVNIIFIPIISSFIFPLSLISVFIPFVDPLLSISINIFECLSVLVSNIDFLTLTMCKMSNVIFILYYVIITFILYMASKYKYKYILLLLIMILLHNNISCFNKNSEITFIDVGQGDATFIKLPNNSGNILVDTGGKEYFYYDEWQNKNNSYSIGKDTIIPYLKSIGIKKLDYLILTHGDFDHLGESISIINNMNIDSVVFNYGSVNDSEKKIIELLEVKDIDYYFYKDTDNIKINKYNLFFISPIKDYGNENDNSLVFYLDIDNTKFLFTGDISKKVETDIIDKYKINVDVLKVAHHGSKTSSDISFINNISPMYSIISVGLNNNFNHPSDETIKNLRNTRIYKTSTDGSIKFILNNNVTILNNRT